MASSRKINNWNFGNASSVVLTVLDDYKFNEIQINLVEVASGPLEIFDFSTRYMT